MSFAIIIDPSPPIHHRRLSRDDITAALVSMDLTNSTQRITGDADEPLCLKTSSDNIIKLSSDDAIKTSIQPMKMKIESNQVTFVVHQATKNATIKFFSSKRKLQSHHHTGLFAYP